jgi:hypothetical protein
MTFAAGAQGPSAPKLTCDRGPLADKTYGGTAWNVYGCNDNRSVAIVSAAGNPAMPFYFLLFAEANGQYTLSGEGTGRREFTRKAYDELSRLTPQEIDGLVRQARKPRPNQ